MCGLLLGASRCNKQEDDGDNPSEGGGSAGSSGGDPSPVQCGPKTCSDGQICCNRSCGICTPPDGVCTQQACDSGAGAGGTGGASGTGGGGDDPPPMSSDGPHCGGIAGIACPGLGSCVDDPSDSCNPRRGGADCGGLCECSAKAKCKAGMKWDASPEVCDCVGPEDGAGSGGNGDAGSGGAAAGSGAVVCGSSTCADGEVCCNASCGICTAPGEGCTKQLCTDPGTDPTPQRCGGFGGFACPGSGECIDDPSDDCDPKNGGADCGGICTCMSGAAVLCIQGTQWNSDPHVCTCAPNSGGPVGDTCGKNVCPVDQTCCNASCGLCAPKGGACIQIACL